MLSKLQASHNTKLLDIYLDQFEIGYWAGYAKAERIARGDPKSFMGGTPKPSRSIEFVEPSSAEGTSEITMTASVELSSPSLEKVP